MSELDKTNTDRTIHYRHIAFHEFDKQIRGFMQSWDIPGASVALAKDGEIQYKQAFGKADSNTEIRTDNVFRIASLSKPITALAIMVLAEQGKLQLDDLVFGEKGILSSLNYSNMPMNV